MSKYFISSNIVNKDSFRSVTKNTLSILSNALTESFGPLGSNSAINETNTLNKYSKDGRTILNSIRFNGIIEETVREDIKEVTRTVDMKVGDGTTSAVVLSNIVYRELLKFEESDTKYNPYELIRTLNNISDRVADMIRSNGKEFDADTAYSIASISTNGDEFMSSLLRDIYGKYGKDVYIDVNRSNDEDTKIKTIDGLLLDSGYSDPGLINTTDNKCIIKDANIYVFQNNVDTPEMVNFLRAIISDNLTDPLMRLQAGDTEDVKIVPTVIIAPSISRDQSPYLENLLLSMAKLNIDNKMPLLIITNRDKDKLYDISKICGCKTIQKYIDFEQQQVDVESGLAPTLETISDFCGYAEMVISDASSTSFVNPKYMYEDKEHTIKHETYQGLINFVKTEIEESERNNEGIVKIGKLKKRLHYLEANMVELYIGGISSTDRDYYQDLVVDAVKNCRSAAMNGAGYGANVEGLLALDKLIHEESASELEQNMIELLYNSYRALVETVYQKNDIDNPVDTILEAKTPININTSKIDERVLCSIETDIEILRSVIKIVSVLFTSNQFIATSPAIASPYKTLEDYTTED